MQGDRTELFAQVAEQQAITQTEDEQKRAEIAEHINGIYERTKTQVETILSELDAEVAQTFDTGAEAARQTFENYVDRETEAYKQERYGGWLGWARWIEDQFVTNEELNAIVDRGVEQYLAEMDAVIDQVVSIISTRLSEAKAEVAQGKQEVQEYVSQLPEDLQTIGQEAAQEVQGNFDQLEQSIDDKQGELIDTLANKYQESLEIVNTRAEEMREANKGLIDKAIDAVAGVIQTILRLKNMLMNVISNAVDAIKLIIADPIGFVGNLISSVKMGLENFVGNIASHLQQGFVEWLTGTLGEAGIQMPEDIFSLEGILDLVLQVLGLTWENFRARAVGIFGETVVQALETGFEIFLILKDEGLVGVWEWVQDKLADLQDMVIEGIKEMLIVEVIEAGIKWLVGLLGGPAGAFIKAAMMIYDIVMWFINNASRIASLITAIVDSVKAIASGSLDAAAKYVEESLANFIPMAIGFLASLLGLGDLAVKVRKIIDKVQEPINEAIDYLLNMIKGFVQKIGKMLGVEGEGGGGEGDGEIGKEVTFSAGEESHRLWVEVEGSQATIKVASEEMPLEDRLADWEDRVDELTEEQQGQAQGLLSQARSLMSGADDKADTLAAKKEAVKTLDDGPELEQQDSALEADEEALKPVLQSLFELYGELPPGDIVTLPFDMAGASHTLFIEHTEDQLQVSMASRKDKVEYKFTATRAVLEDYRSYLETVTDEEVEENLQSLMEVIEDGISSALPGLLEKVSGTNVKSKDVPAILKEAEESAQAIIAEVSEIARDLFPDLEPQAVRQALDEMAYQAWEAAWHSKQDEVTSALEGFLPALEALDPAGVMQIRGSLAKGIKNARKVGPGGERLRFNPEEFDVDLYVVSQRLFDEAVEQGAPLRGEGEIVGSQSEIPGFEQLVRDIRDELAKISGNKDSGDEAWKFNIFLRTPANAEEAVAEERADAVAGGLPPERGDPLTIEPPTEEDEPAPADVEVEEPEKVSEG